MRTKSCSIFTGKWALVTGATSGIGESFARILAKEKVNLVLTGRQLEKLIYLRNEFILKYSIQVEILAIDLSNKGSVETIFNFCKEKSINIEVLINNAGYAMRTEDEILHPQKVTAMLQVMVVSLTELCYRFGAVMKQNKKGWILNVSSIVGCFPAASTLTYCASKRYIIEYSKYLHFELVKDGISVTCLLPGPTKTNFSINNSLPIPKKLLLFYLSSDQVALEGLSALTKNRMTVITGGTSKLLVMLSRLIPPVIIYRAQQLLWVQKRDRYF